MIITGNPFFLGAGTRSSSVMTTAAPKTDGATTDVTPKLLMPTITTVGYNGRRGDGTLQAQGWNQISGAAFTPVPQNDGKGGYWLNIVKDAGVVWEIKQPASLAPTDLIRYGGRIFCRFRLKGPVVNNQYAFAFYLRVPESDLPAGVTLANKTAGTGPALAAFCITTAGNKITLSQHRTGGSPIVPVCDYGKFDNEWHTLELLYTGNNSITVLPLLDGRAHPAISLSYTSALIPDKVITVTGITRGNVYELDVSSFEGQIYRDNISRALSEDDDGLQVFIPPSYHTASVMIPDKPFRPGFSVSINVADAFMTIFPENENVLIQPPGSPEGYPAWCRVGQSVTLIQTDVTGKTWVMV